MIPLKGPNDNRVQADFDHLEPSQALLLSTRGQTRYLNGVKIKCLTFS